MQHSRPIKRHRSASEVRELVVRFHQSGLSRADFVRKEGICLATLGSYLKRESTAATPVCRSGPPAFFELEPGTFQSLRGSPQAMYRLCLAGGHTLDFKARVALEAIKGIRTVQQIAAENELHPTQVTQWKTQMLVARFDSQSG